MNYKLNSSRKQASRLNMVLILSHEEYGDYECPFCAQAYLIVKEVQERLGRKLRFVFRSFPLIRLRPHVYQSALAAETAAAQGKFWEMYDFLFKHGQSLTDDNLRLSFLVHSMKLAYSAGGRLIVWCE